MLNIQNIIKSLYLFKLILTNTIINNIIKFFIIIYVIDFILFYIDKIIFYNTQYYKEQCIKYGDKIYAKNRERKYYILHAFVNTYITCITFSDMLYVLYNPLDAINETYNNQSMCIIISLHVFHIITSFWDMDIVDWLHHLINALFVGSITLMYYKGKIINYINFFMCGFPGLLDYCCLILNKYGIINKLVEKKVNFFQNMWLRLPGIIIGCFIGYLNYIYNNKYNYSPYFVGLLFILTSGNCIYFAGQVAKSYGYYQCIEKHKYKLKDN